MSNADAAATTSGRTMLGVALVIASTICLSLTPTIAKLAYLDGANTLTVLTLRGLGAVAFLALLMGAFDRRWSWDIRDLFAAVMAGLWYCLMLFGYFGSVNYIDAKLAILIYFLHPVFIVATSAIMKRQSLPRAQLVLSLVIFLALGLVLGAEVSALDWRGVALGVISAIGITGVILLNAKAQRTMTALAVNLVMTAVTTLVFGLITVASGDWSFPQSHVGWLAILTTAVGVVLGLVTFFKAFQYIGVVRATMLSNVEPLIGIVIAYALLGERLTGFQILGAVVIIACLFGFEWVGRRAVQNI